MNDYEAMINQLGNSEDEFSDDEDDQNKNQYFQVDDAEPPTNYDDPYSTLPGKINLKNIKVSQKSIIDAPDACSVNPYFAHSHF